MDIVLNTAPDEDDVLSLLSVADFKANERLTHTAHDATVIPEVIKNAYAFLDGQYGWLNRSILTQKWDLWLPSFFNSVELPYGPVSAVDSIKYYDTNDVLQTLAATNYEVITDNTVSSVVKAYNVTWPTLDERKRAVQITYTAGWGTSDTIPFPVKSAIRRAMLLLASHFYRNPSATYGEPRAVVVNRKVEYGLESLIGFLRRPPDHR